MSGCVEAIRALLDRIDAREDAIGAWVHLDRDGALARARALDALAPAERGALHGMAIGVKDVLDTVDMPTAFNSPIHAGRRPARDAEVVRRLRAAGAIILGKTVTTEFAFTHPGRTRNPHDLACTPGGSSSGSAAAVAAGMVPVALATQTGGSTIRPAAFCGVLGYKPAFGRYPTAGLKHLAPSLDTIGLHARAFDDLARASAVMAGEAAPARPVLPRRPRVALVRTPHDGAAEPQALARLHEAAQALRSAGAAVRTIDLPPALVEVDALQHVIMAAEAAQSLAAEWASARDRLSANLAGFIAEGLAHDAAAVAAARARIAAGARAIDTLVGDDEVILTLPAPGEAPRGLASTGSAVFNRLWTMLGVPCITLPAGRGARGLPLGVQLVARRDAGDEAGFFAHARWVHEALAAAGHGH
ncbi:MAG: amidase [Burkholderiales bacterium]|nr:amidase [Burkholderiales bacterium]